MRTLFAGIAAMLILASCGSESKAPAGTDLQSGSKNAVQPRAQLLLFGAPWCTNCKRDFPIIRDLISKAPAAAQNQLAVKMYVTTGARATDKPTQAVADAYLDFFKLRGEALVDPWRWKNFKMYISEDRLDLPGAAVLDANGKLLRAYEAGPATFVPQQIVEFALGAAK